MTEVTSQAGRTACKEELRDTTHVSCNQGLIRVSWAARHSQSELGLAWVAWLLGSLTGLTRGDAMIQLRRPTLPAQPATT